MWIKKIGRPVGRPVVVAWLGRHRKSGENSLYLVAEQNSVRDMFKVFVTFLVEIIRLGVPSHGVDDSLADDEKGILAQIDRRALLEVGLKVSHVVDENEVLVALKLRRDAFDFPSCELAEAEFLTALIEPNGRADVATTFVVKQCENPEQPRLFSGSSLVHVIY